MSTQARWEGFFFFFKRSFVPIFQSCFYVFITTFSPQVSLVATAPLTNLALAVKLDPSLPSKLHGLYIMGGNTDCQ